MNSKRVAELRRQIKEAVGRNRAAQVEEGDDGHDTILEQARLYDAIAVRESRRHPAFIVLSIVLECMYPVVYILLVVASVVALVLDLIFQISSTPQHRVDVMRFVSYVFLFQTVPISLRRGDRIYSALRTLLGNTINVHRFCVVAVLACDMICPASRTVCLSSLIVMFALVRTLIERVI